MPTLLWNSIVLIPPRVCDISLWIVLSRQGPSLNAGIYPFRVCRKENEEPRRLSEEIKRDVKLKLTYTETGTNLRSSWGSLKSFWKYGERSDGLWVWRFECSEGYELRWRKKEMIFMGLYIGNWKRGGFYPAQILKKKSRPLDQNPTVGFQERNATQNTWWRFANFESSETTMKWLKWPFHVREFEYLCSFNCN